MPFLLVALRMKLWVGVSKINLDVVDLDLWAGEHWCHLLACIAWSTSVPSAASGCSRHTDCAPAPGCSVSLHVSLNSV